MGATVAAKNRKVRQDALREYLAEKQHERYVVENIEDIEKLSPYDKEGELDHKALAAAQFQLKKLETAARLRMNLVDKYLPSLKSTELTGEDGKDLIPASITITYE